MVRGAGVGVFRIHSGSFPPKGHGAPVGWDGCTRYSDAVMCRFNGTVLIEANVCKDFAN